MLISRSVDRLRDLSFRLRAKHPRALTHFIVLDMAKEGSGDRNVYLNKILKDVMEMCGQDLRIIVNNAGVNTRGLFRDISPEEVREMALVNTYPYAYLTHSLLPLLSLQKFRHTLVLTICSVISFLPSAYDAVYAGTKVFERYLFEAIRMENRGHNRIKFLSMHPQYVSTNNARLHPGGLVETTESFVRRGVFRVVSRRIYNSCGTWKHELFAFVSSGVAQIFRFTNIMQKLNEKVIHQKASVMWQKRI